MINDIVIYQIDDSDLSFQLNRMDYIKALDEWSLCLLYIFIKWSTIPSTNLEQTNKKSPNLYSPVPWWQDKRRQWHLGNCFMDKPTLLYVLMVSLYVCMYIPLFGDMFLLNSPTVYFSDAIFSCLHIAHVFVFIFFLAVIYQTVLSVCIFQVRVWKTSKSVIFIKHFTNLFIWWSWCTGAECCRFLYWGKIAGCLRTVSPPPHTQLHNQYKLTSVFFFHNNISEQQW